MRAIVQQRYGPYADVLALREIPTPIVGPGQVLVAVRATSVHADVWHAVQGIPYVMRMMGSGVRSPKQRIPGTDLAGEVVAVGPGTHRFVVGDRVYGEITRGANLWTNGGAFAEFVAVNEGLLMKFPDHLSFEEAAAVPTAAMIALTNLRDSGQVRAGQRVLVNGAGGAVGVWAVQLAQAFGAQVTAVDAPAKLDLLRGLGADTVIDYTQQDFTLGGVRYDVVFDIVSQMPFRQVRHALQPDGTFVLIGHDQYGQSGHRVFGSLTRMFPLLAISPVVKQIPPIRSGPPRAENLATITELLANRKIRPVVDDQTFPLEHVVPAMDHLTSGTAKGRVVLTVS